MSNDNLVLRLKKLWQRRTKLDKLEALANSTYHKHQLNIQILLDYDPYRRCTKDHIQLVQHMMYCTRKNENLQRRRYIPYYPMYRAYDRLQRSKKLLKPAVHYAVVDTLNALFDAKQIVVPHIVDHIAAETQKLNEEIVDQRHREWTMKREETKKYDQLKGNNWSARYCIHRAGLCKTVKAEILGYIYERKEIARRRTNRFQALLRFVDHQIWRLQILM